MKVRRSLGLGLAGVLAIGLGIASRGDPVQDASAPAPVVFVCRNGVAMSVWSAAYFNRLAAERGLRERAVARAAIPSFEEVPLRMRLALALDRFRLDGYRPRVIDAADTRGAERVVVILPAEAPVPDDAHAEIWQGFPPMREQYFPSRAALTGRVESLVARLAAGEGASRSVP